MQGKSFNSIDATYIIVMVSQYEIGREFIAILCGGWIVIFGLEKVENLIGKLRNISVHTISFPLGRNAPLLSGM